MALQWLYVMFSCYLLGALPSGYLAGRLTRGLDIRTLGDRNPGAANVWAQVGRSPAVVVAVIDMGKGAAAVLLARLLLGSDSAPLWGGLAAVAGHNWPFFLGFRGGRGAATTLGILATLLPQAVLPLSAVAAIPLALTRSTTVAFSFVYIPLPLVAWLFSAPPHLIAYSVALPVLVGLAHFVTTKRLPGRVSPRAETKG